MRDDEIEVLDNNEEVVIEKKVIKKKKLNVVLLIQAIFCTLSILFILACCGFYGFRFIKWYKIYNPKVENGKMVSLLSNYIEGKSSFVYEGDGTYKIGGSILYKGENTNNYLIYNGLIWRIIKVNKNNTIDIALDQPINLLKWNNEIDTFDNSDISKYLNNEFIKLVNKDDLVKTVVCNDIIDDVTKITCDDISTNNYVRLLDIKEFLNSKTETSYLTNGENIWLSNRGSESVWNINDLNVSYSDSNNGYYVKPVITLKSSTPLVSGNGTLDNPFIIYETKKEITYGSYVKLGNDTWNVYNTDNKNIYLSLSTTLNQPYSFDDTSNIFNPETKNSLAYYLNNDYYNSLSYKDKLLETTWYNAEYEKSYSYIKDSNVKAKVGLLSVSDFKFDDLTSYYLLNGFDSNSLIYDTQLIDIKPSYIKKVRPCIMIEKKTIKTGTGTIDDPYIMED